MEHGQKDFLIHSFSGIGVKLTDRQIEQFLLYFELLAEWNEKINLTAITDYEDVVIKHFVDSVAAVRALERCIICWIWVRGPVFREFR